MTTRRSRSPVPAAGIWGLLGAPVRWAWTGAVAFVPALIAYLLVAGLQRHRPDLGLSVTGPVVVIIALAGWITLRATVSVADLPARPAPSPARPTTGRERTSRSSTGRWTTGRLALGRRPEFGDLARLAVPLVGGVYLLVAVGVLVRLRLSGLAGSSRVPLAGLTVSLAIGSAGLVALVVLVRSLQPERVARITADGRGSPGPAGVAIVVAALAVVVLTILGRDNDARFGWGAEQIRPASLVPLLTVTAFAVIAAMWTRRPIDDDQRGVPVYLMLVLVAGGAGLVLAFGPDDPSPSVAAAVGLTWLVAVRTGSRRAPAIGLTAILAGYALFATLSGSLVHNPYTDPNTPDAHAALALARAGAFGRGPGQGLVESYGSHGTVPSRYALNVVAEELGLIGLLLVLAVTILIGVLLVRLATRCGHGLLGAWAQGLTAATLITLALPVLALLYPTLDIDVSPPAIAPDNLGLIALLWTIGALLGAASRKADTAPSEPAPHPGSVIPTQRVSQAAADSFLDGLRTRVGGLVVEPVVVGLAVIAMLVAVPLSATAADHRRATADRGNILATTAANTARTVRLSVRWPQPAALVDDATRRAVDGTVTTTYQCPAQASDRVTGATFSFGRGCPTAQLVSTLDVDAQTAANNAIYALPNGVRAGTVAIDISDGRLLVLADGTGTTYLSAADPPSDEATPPQPGHQAPPTNRPRSTAPGNPKESGSALPQERIAASASVGTDAGVPAGVGDGDEAPQWSTAVPTGEKLISDLLNASPALAQALLADLRADALTRNRAGIANYLDVRPDLINQAIASPLAKDDHFALVLSAADTMIKEDFQGCITLDHLDKVNKPQNHTPHFAPAPSCAVRLAKLILARGAVGSPQPGAVRTLIDRWMLTGPAGTALHDEGLGTRITEASGLQTSNNPTCDGDTGCLRTSPLQLATVLAGLINNAKPSDLARPDKSPPPFLLTTQSGPETQARHNATPWHRPGSTAPRSDPTHQPSPWALAGLSKIPAMWTNDTASLDASTGGASWSVRVLPKTDEHGRVVLVSYRTSKGTPQPDEKPASTLTAPVADALAKDGHG
ncbi:FtsW/RodA/SpoVE family cell cycle protein [Frankia sp. R82]|uniref:FtsW/RodA/SpoVE family cell cycle protein n=1 Tax=Frankia sp. R82 TaxID=2950553 RepID=UPI0020433026|nr:FtsW/RodA/SpoVE family cell cycle protein [Frankia sp. R82]MCM3887428.1 FtsW/RodA/SpoVE family cell cycle protein [Frankia sp. R82]